MTSKQRVCLTTVLAVLMLVAFSVPAFSRQAGKTKEPRELWEDFIHYIKVYQPTAARSNAQALLESGFEPREIYKLSKKTGDLEAILKRGEGVKELKDVIGRLRKMLREGFRAEATDPKEISEAIDRLDGSLSQFNNASDDLVISGEYCLPQMLRRLVDKRTSKKLRGRIITVLPRLGPKAVNALSASLQSDNSSLQEAVANALREIGYAHCAGRLKELSVRPETLDRVKSAARTALITCAGRDTVKKSVADVFYDQAIKYYYGYESLRPDTKLDTANVWFWRNGQLTYKPVPRAIFLDVYAMRMAQLALKYERDDKKSQKALSLWLSAYLRKESNLPAGATDPTHSPDTPTARFYALSAGPRFLMPTLDRSLRDKNAAVALGAIEALARTSTSESLIQEFSEADQSVNPLVRALAFPDRNVRFLAAVSLGQALPHKRFKGDGLVITVLKEALRQTGKKIALVVAAGEKANSLLDAVRADGYDVVARGDPEEAIAAGREASGIDMVVLGNRPNPLKFIKTLRSDPAFAGLPVVVVFRSADLRVMAASDKRIVLIPADSDAAAIGKAITRAKSLGIGSPLTAEQADQWAIRAAGTIRLLGQTGNKVFNLSRVLGALSDATGRSNTAVRIAAAGALAVIKSDKAQQAIAKLACSNSATPDVRISALGLLSESLRRYGNLLGATEIEAIKDVVSGNGAMKLRDAAAQALGAMDLPSDKIRSLILQVK